MRVELLIYKIVSFFKNKAINILDIGTGSGCILLSILKELNSSRGVGIDISTKAIQMAKINSKKLNLANRSNFKVYDLSNNRDVPYLFYDTDSDGLGDAAVTWDGCSAEVPDGFVADNTDKDDNCFSNDIDGCGVCNGDGSTCTGCIDPDAFNYDCYYGEIPPCNNNLIIDDGSCI